MKKNTSNTLAHKITSAVLACTLTLGFIGLSPSDNKQTNFNIINTHADDKNSQGYTKLDSLEDDSKVPSPDKKSGSGFTYIEGVLIVNKAHSIPESYVPNGGKLEEIVETQFKNMKEAAKKDGKKLVLGRGYVSYKDTKKIYDNVKNLDKDELKKQGISDASQVEEILDLVVDEPGHSELQTGLSVCIKNKNKGNIDNESFKQSEEYTWLKDNAHKYGFILRYPEGAEKHTGKYGRSYQYTYVGKAKATAIHDSGVSLEEYLGISADGTSNGGSGSSGDSSDRNWHKESSQNDPDWLISKDDWRHGITADNGGDGNLIEYKLGMASGRYAIDLKDGKWYWYHQGNDACDYCEDWSDKLWAKKTALSKTGSPVYAMAILVSNLTNTATTPSTLLVDSGAKNGDSFDLSGSCLFDTEGKPKDVDEFKKFLEEKYDLEVKKINVDKKETCKSEIDKMLNNGGMILYRHNCTSKGTWWPAMNTDSHFICIRKAGGGKYYILDQTMKSFDDMNNGIDFDEIWNNMIRNGSSTYLLGVRNPNVITIGGTSSGNWITDAASIGTYKTTTLLGTFNGESFYLYDGLPWKYETGAYFVDLNQAAIDLESYVKSVSTNKTIESGMGYSSVEEIVNNIDNRWIAPRGQNEKNYPSLQGGFTNANGGSYKKIDGLACVGFCPPPCVADRNYNVNFGASKDGQNMWLTRTTPDGYGYGTRKYVGVFKKISGGENDGKLYYLPLAASDAKAHTFPGGIGQTGICLSGNYSPDAKGAIELDSSGNPKKINSVYVAEYSKDFATKLSNRNWNELMDIMNTKYHYSQSDNVTQWDRLWNIGEFTRLPICVSNVICGGDYKLIGFVAYPE